MIGTWAVAEGGVPLRSDTKSIHNKVIALETRVGRQMPTMNKYHRERFRRFARNWIIRNIAPISFEVDPRFGPWFETRHFPAAKALKYLMGHQQFGEIIDVEMIWDLVMRANESDCFIKPEFYTEPKAPRAIMSRLDAVKALLGPIFHLVSKVVFAHPQFIKTVPVRERPAYVRNMLQFPGATYIETDYSKFESHFGVWLMHVIDYELLRHILKEMPERDVFLRLYRETIAGRGKLKFRGLMAFLTGRRQSGEMNTSLSNGLADLLFMLYMAFICGAEVDMVVEGDDGLCVWRGAPLPTKRDFAAMGINIDFLSFDNINEAGFCSMIHDVESGIIVTDPIKQLCRFGWLPYRYADLREGKKDNLLRAKALSILYQYPGCPVLADYALYIVCVTASGGTQGVDSVIRKGGYGVFDAHQMKILQEAQTHATNSGGYEALYVKPTNEARQLVVEHFGLAVSTQMYLEALFKSWAAAGQKRSLTCDAFWYAVPDCWKDNWNMYVATRNDHGGGDWLPLVDPGRRKAPVITTGVLF